MTAPIGEMVAILERERLLLVVGPSGIGKSSVVKAGLVPALAGGAVAGSESWLVTEMVPGREPFEQLAAALERVANVALPDVVGELTASTAALDDVVRRLVPRGTGVLVVVDQLEELFTQTVDDGDRRDFLQMMVELAERPTGPVRVVATLRADYFDRPLEHPGFGEAVARPHDRPRGDDRRPSSPTRCGSRPPRWASRSSRRSSNGSPPRPSCNPAASRSCSTRWPSCSAAGRRTRSRVAGYDEAGGLAGSIGRRAETIYKTFDERRSGGDDGGLPPLGERDAKTTRTPGGGCAGPSWSRAVSPPTTSTRCSASTDAIACSRSTAIPSAARRPSSWRTKR